MTTVIADHLTYDYNETTKTLTITGTGNVNSMSYGKITSQSFDCSGMEHLIIGDSVGTLGSAAFRACSSLLDVDFGGATSTGETVFYQCTSLRKIDLPATLTTIGYATFAACTNLREIIFRQTSKPTFTNDYIFNGSFSTVNIYSPGWANASNMDQHFSEGTTKVYHNGIPEEYYNITIDGKKVQSDSAIRDGNGAKIDTTYLPAATAASTYLPLSGGTLTGSLTLTGTNGITSNNIIFQDWELATARNASNKLYRYVGIDVNSTTGWLKTRDADDVKADLGINDKLDKVTSTSAYPRVYSVNEAGTNSTSVLEFSGIDGWTIVGRDANGCVHTATPTTNNHAANKAYVDNAITTYAATFRGTYIVDGTGNDGLGLTITYDSTTGEVTGPTTSQVATAIASKMTALSITPTKNDYVFVSWDFAQDTGNIDKYDRYAYSGSAWSYEYTLNNSSFTTAQWAAINSGATSSIINDVYPASRLTSKYLASWSNVSHTYYQLAMFSADTGQNWTGIQMSKPINDSGNVKPTGTTNGVGGTVALNVDLSGKQDVLTSGEHVVITPALPSGYTRLESITSSGTQYINTGVAVDNDNSFELDFESAAGNNEGYLISQGNNSIRQSGGTITWYTGLKNFQFNVSTSNRYLVKCGYNYISVNGNFVTGTSDSDAASGTSVYLLAKNDGNAKAISTVFRFKIFDSTDALVFDGIPAKRDSDDAVGLYDIVSNTFKANAGTGSFTAGTAVTNNNVVDTINVLPRSGGILDGNLQVNGDIIIQNGKNLKFGTSGDGITELSNPQYVMTFGNYTSGGLYWANCSNLPISTATQTALNGKLNKLTYEWNYEYAETTGNTGCLLLFDGYVYDSNITIDVDATTSTTMHGTLVIACQNSSPASAVVYGDGDSNLTSRIKIVPPTGMTSTETRRIKVYFKPSTYSKNLIHIRAQALYSSTVAMGTFSTGDFPAGATWAPTNALDSKLNKDTTGAYKLYGTSVAGTQTMLTYAYGATADTVAYRDTGGVLSVGTPTANAHAATKKYVDDSVGGSMPGNAATATTLASSTTSVIATTAGVQFYTGSILSSAATDVWCIETYANGTNILQRATNMSDPSDVAVRTSTDSGTTWAGWTYSYAVWKV